MIDIETIYINAYEYDCENPNCEQKTYVEDFDGYVSRYSRFSTRCEDFIVTLALETSCEGAARICKHMGIRVSGDTIIKLLKRRFEQNPPPKCGEIIGIDDWAYKKGHTYCTIVCDGTTHNPIAVMDGRDGKSLKEWLQNNKHVKIVTRDRASTYAKVILEELPEAMQIADRFHLHYNLLTAIKEALRSEVPDKIEIKDNTATPEPVEVLKKRHRRNDRFSETQARTDYTDTDLSVPRLLTNKDMQAYEYKPSCCAKVRYG